MKNICLLLLNLLLIFLILICLKWELMSFDNISILLILPIILITAYLLQVNYKIYQNEKNK